MTEADVHRLLALEPDRRNAVMLRVIYGAGLRISEACSLRWRDLRRAGGCFWQGRQDARHPAPG